VDTLVMGRKTYETAVGFDPWPYAGKRCVVLTHEAPASRHGEEFYAGDLVALVERFGTQSAKRVYIDGGEVIAQFLAAGLVDDVTVSVIPVMLGAGRPLAPNIGNDVRLRLTEPRAFESGLVQVSYRVETGANVRRANVRRANVRSQ
jgi:dihydrofolate reductase